jgi:hypothetical protein
MKQDLYRNNSKTVKLLNALANGERVTAAAARKRFNIQNVRAEATRIRKLGVSVSAERRIAGNNRKVVEYVLA